MDDDELRAQLAEHLDTAFERLALAYQHRLYAFALRLCGRREDAEEIAQDALVRAYRALVSYPPERVRALALRAWLFQITLNVARNRARGYAPHLESIEAESDDSRMEPAGAECDQPEALVERAERSEELASLLLSLPMRFRSAVILRHVHGLGYAEIAVALDQPVGTVKANVHRGVRLLREALARELSEVR